MCAIDYCDETFSVYRQNRTCKARKPHHCDECGRTIEKGEVYFYAFGAMEGSGNSFHTCAHCTIAAQWLMDNCGGFVHSGVSEDISEHISEYPSLAPGLYRFKVGMRKKWRNFANTGLMPIPRQAKPITVHQ